MENKLLIVFVLIFAVVVSGCVGVSKEAPDNESAAEKVIGEAAEETAEENLTKAEEENITVEEPVPAVKKLALKNIQTPTFGENPAIQSYNGTLHFAFERFTGENEDLFHVTFDGTSFSKAKKIFAGNQKEIEAALEVYKEKLYLFYTKTPRDKSIIGVISFRSYETEWGDEKTIGYFDTTLYYYNPSLTLYDNRLRLFYNRNIPNEMGKLYSISSETTESWVDEPNFVISGFTNDKETFATSYNGAIALIYESYSSGAKSNDIYFRSYDGSWSSAKKISVTDDPVFKYSPTMRYFNGKFYAVWIENGELYGSTSANGDVWGEKKRLTENSYADTDPYLAEHNGSLYLAWAQKKKSTSYLQLAEVTG